MHLTRKVLKLTEGLHGTRIKKLIKIFARIYIIYQEYIAPAANKLETMANVILQS